MIKVRKSNERGHANFGWLNSRHTFSFGGYYDPRYQGFSDLLVINDDRVTPDAGFGTHPHNNMEIISYVLEGALEHKDTIGTTSVIRPGEVQRMTAGTGIMHSEFNHSKTEPVHFLQIWIEPGVRGLKPGYEQKKFDETERRNRFRVVASDDGRDDSVTVHQDVRLYAATIDAGQTAEQSVAANRKVWVQVARGAIDLNGTRLEEGDGAAIIDEQHFRVTAENDAEVLLFDLAA